MTNIPFSVTQDKDLNVLECKVTSEYLPFILSVLGKTLNDIEDQSLDELNQLITVRFKI